MPVAISRRTFIAAMLAAGITHAASGEGDPSMILDTGWRITEIEGAALARDMRPSLTLASDGSFFGRACNGFRGSYAIEGERLAFGRVAATRMACAGPLMAMETALFAALRRVAGYRLMRNGALWLEDEDGNVLIEAYRDDQ